MTDQELEQRLRAWYRAAVADDLAAPADLRSRVVHIPQTSPARWRRSRRGQIVTLLAAAALLMIAIGALAGGSGTFTGPAPVSSAVAATLPELSLPGSRGGRAGEYGWEGGPDERPWGAGLHRVIEHLGEYREVTALFFAVGADCLGATTEQQTPVRVAGFNGVFVERYEPPVRFIDAGDETTRAYALAVGDRTLCVFLTWHPTTTDDELAAAVRILDSLRAEPIGEDRIRIVFTLEDVWDTG